MHFLFLSISSEIGYNINSQRVDCTVPFDAFISNYYLLVVCYCCIFFFSFSQKETIEFNNVRLRNFENSLSLNMFSKIAVALTHLRMYSTQILQSHFCNARFCLFLRMLFRKSSWYTFSLKLNRKWCTTFIHKSCLAQWKRW